MDYSTLPLIRTLYCGVLSKEVSSTILKVFGMTRLEIEPRSPGLLGVYSIHSANENIMYVISRFVHVILVITLYNVRFQCYFHFTLNCIFLRLTIFLFFQLFRVWFHLSKFSFIFSMFSFFTKIFQVSNLDWKSADHYWPWTRTKHSVHVRLSKFSYLWLA